MVSFNMYVQSSGARWVDVGCVTVHGRTPEIALGKLKTKLGDEWPKTIDEFTTPSEFASYRKQAYQEEYEKQPSVAFER
jgi:hypothetical protein